MFGGQQEAKLVLLRRRYRHPVIRLRHDYEILTYYMDVQVMCKLARLLASFVLTKEGSL
jgi:hypothetical protein